jgi:hypothetical protein
MQILLGVLGVIAVLILVALALSLRIVQQYEEGVLFRPGRVVGQKKPGLVRIVPLIDVLRRVSLRIVTMPIQSQGIITRDNVIVFPAPLMSTIQELGAFLTQEQAAATTAPPAPTNGAASGHL